MHVVATAGHVDHGKSTLVRALTGQDPDRLEAERRRGLSIELGYCWTRIPGAGDVAFVDVPGHERFVSTMLAGVGPVPAVLFVVAADDPWMPQAAEHLAALDAFGVEHGVVAVTRCDLADPAPMTSLVSRQLAGTSLRDSKIIAVSARTGQGMDDLQSALAAMVGGLPAPDLAAPVRLWVDRRFSLAGAGTVVTGTLPVGRLHAGDELSADGVPVRIRALEMLGESADVAAAVARVGLRLGGSAPESLGRGSALIRADQWHLTAEVDVRVTGSGDVPESPLLHIGSASVAVRARPVGADVYRLRLDRRLPLHVGDRAVLRDAGGRRLWGALVLDPAPPVLARRGAARRRTTELAACSGLPDLADELRRRVVARIGDLRRYGVPVDDRTLDDVAVRAGQWLLDQRAVPGLQRDLAAAVGAWTVAHPLDPAMPLPALAATLGLPASELVAAIVPPALRIESGRVRDARATLPARLLHSLHELEEELTEAPFAAPDAARLAELGLDKAAVAAAVRAGRLLRVSETVVLLPGAADAAAAILSGLPQPFTTSEARVALGTSRRVALALLALLDARRLTWRLPDDRRKVVALPTGADA
ncbi:MAG: selenocysteine-specific translation elongation factor [Nocardioidaceae bacterium]